MFAALLLGVGSLAAAPVDPVPTASELAAYEAVESKVGRDPAAHVKLALWCEAHGLRPERIKHLALAILLDPLNATARGLMGLVDDQGQWSRPEAVSAKVNDDEKLAATLAEYSARRARTPTTQDAQWKLGLWCEQHGLKAEALAHFSAVTRLPAPPRPHVGSLPLFGRVVVPHEIPNHHEAAWKRLGYKKFHGRWMTDDQIHAEKQEAEAQHLADHHWHPLLLKWRGMLSEPEPKRGEAEKAISEVTDPRAIPSVWAVFATGNAAQQARSVQLLGQIEAPSASRGLALLAVLSPEGDVRRRAIETLVRRDPRDFVDNLIDMIHEPVNYEVKPVSGPGKTGILFVEGERFNVRRRYSVAALPDQTQKWLKVYPTYSVPFPDLMANPLAAPLVWDLLMRSDSDPNTSPDFLRTQPRLLRVAMAVTNNLAEARAATLAAQGQMLEDMAAIESYNRMVRLTKPLALYALTTVTGQDLGDKPDDWRAWLTDQKGYVYQPPKVVAKPTFEQNVPPAYNPYYRIVRKSCFGAGTLVQTLTGPRPIESIWVGDQVLTQGLKTGKLSFEPVLVVYHNQPAPTLRIKIGDEFVVATGIHRFWKANYGWVMARDLKVGDPIRIIDGTAEVVSIEGAPVQPVFNLEVANGRSFFVGKQGVLVHDNKLVQPVDEPFDAAPSLASIAPKAH